MHEPIDGPLVVGTRQTLKAIEEGLVSVLYIADDADVSLLESTTEIANSNSLPVIHFETMEELGKACKIQVGTATAALIREIYGGEKDANV